MCPDRQLLSVYLDQELPSPWKEKMEAHLRDCPECRNRLASYRGVSSRLALPADLQDQPGEATVSRVWSGILEGRSKNYEKTRGFAARFPERKFWNSSITLPLPAAAAAAAALLIIAAWGFMKPSGTYSPASAGAMADMTLDLQEIAPASDLAGALQYLGQDQSNDIVIIQLPESRSFMSSGKPTIIKAAEYARGD